MFRKIRRLGIQEEFQKLKKRNYKNCGRRVFIAKKPILRIF